MYVAPSPLAPLPRWGEGDRCLLSFEGNGSLIAGRHAAPVCLTIASLLSQPLGSFAKELDQAARRKADG